VVLSNWSNDTHDLQYADLAGGLDLTGSRFDCSWLDCARFVQANLSGVNLSYATPT
jgi:hypothetical protein